MQSALGDPGLPGKLCERRRAVPIEHLEHVEDGGDPR